jgi:hypothetical protein
MKTKLFLITVLSLIVVSCSKNDDNNKENDDTPTLDEVFQITLDKDTPNEIIVNIDDPYSYSPCTHIIFTAPDLQTNEVLISNLAFNVPGEIIVYTSSIEVGETIPNDDLGPLSWGFTIELDGVSYEASSGVLSFSKYDNSAWTTTGGPILISGILDIQITEVGGSQSRTVLINFDNVQLQDVGAC